MTQTCCIISAQLEMTLSNTHISTPSYFISELEKHLPCLKAGKEVNPQPLRPPTKEKPFQKKKKKRSVRHRSCYCQRVAPSHCPVVIPCGAISLCVSLYTCREDYSLRINNLRNVQSASSIKVATQKKKKINTSLLILIYTLNLRL